ncbi:MAG: hypothetical protein HZB51_20660 [Chloroflexi bacterium]|nr:hypothetical protein [Chloroflexota bacterium]
MNKFLVLALTALVLIVGLAACASAPTPTPVPTAVPPTAVPASPTRPAPTATTVPPTTAPTAVPPTTAPTAVPPTTAPTAVPPTPTRVPPTAVPTSTPVPPTPIPAGLYVSSLKIQPEQAAYNQNVTFAPTILNATNGPLDIKWTVYIFKADEPTKSNNETSAQLTTFPVGSKEFTSAGSFRYGGTGRTCEYFFARVGYFDPDNKIVYFKSPDGKVYEKGFQVCDVSILPTAVPVSAPPTAVPPTPKPGLFVTDMRIQPAPQRGVDLSFFPTFTNNSGNQMTFTWRVLIYKADNLNTSLSDTSWLLTHFTTNPGEVASDGKWKLPLGGGCENFVARVGWRDANNQTQLFMKPDGTVFSKPFTVCPP